jgi:hypothetical protein
LKRAKRYLESPTTRESIIAAQLALRSIPLSATEYKEAQKLLTRSELDLKAVEARVKAEEATHFATLFGLIMKGFSRRRTRT